MSGPEARRRLAEEQTAVLKALLGQGEAPPGFAAKRLHASAAALENKRLQAVIRVWPSLVQALGDRFEARFATFAQTTPLPALTVLTVACMTMSH